jgi:hypothetical protein
MMLYVITLLVFLVSMLLMAVGALLGRDEPSAGCGRTDCCRETSAAPASPHSVKSTDSR